jgi:FKBP-type peptidyl-prolyl cis-trans isomerase FklB
MRLTIFLTISALVAPVALVSAAESLSIEGESARISYSLGHQIGGQLEAQGIEIDAPAFTRGIEDAISGAEPLMPAAEMQSTLTELKRKLIAEQQEKEAAAAEKITAEGKAFLEENAKQPNVVTTASGLQYQIIEPGSGKHPSPSDRVTVHYRGTLVDGQEFDSSYKRGEPTSFQLDGVIAGWTEGLQLIKEGGKMKLVIPPELAYGDTGRLAHQTLVFEVELIKVEAAE